MPSRSRIVGAVLSMWWLVVCPTTPTVSVVWAEESDSTSTDQEKLEQDFTDPLATLPQLTMRDAYAPANFGTDEQTNQLIIRPIIPRVPPQTLLPVPQLIRPTFSVVTIPDARGGTRTEFGDMQLFDVAVLPGSSAEAGRLIAFGPSFIFPTATFKRAGQGAWQVGPAFAAISKAVPGLLAGFIVQNPISFAYTSSDRSPQNTLFFQPVFALHLIDKWYLRSAEAAWTIGWRHNTPTTIPLSMALGRTISLPGRPPMSVFVGGQWMAYRQFAPVAPQTIINFGMTVAFPELSPW